MSSGLLEKIRGYFATGDRLGDIPPHLHRPFSIRDNLKRYLNTRVGSLVAIGDYGIMDIPEIIGKVPSDIGIFEGILLKGIAKYEPRAIRTEFVKWGIIDADKVLFCLMNCTTFDSVRFEYRIVFRGIGRNEVIYIKKPGE